MGKNNKKRKDRAARRKKQDQEEAPKDEHEKNRSDGGAEGAAEKSAAKPPPRPPPSESDNNGDAADGAAADDENGRRIDDEGGEGDHEGPAAAAAGGYNWSDDDDDASSDDDDDLVLEGVLTKRPTSDDEHGGGDDGGDSDSEDSSDDDGDEEEEEEERPSSKKRARTSAKGDNDGSKRKSKGKEPPSKQNKKQASKKEQNKKQKKGKGKPKKPDSGSDTDEDAPADIINVDFTFCDMAEKYFHGLRTLLLTHPSCAPRASPLADLMIANSAVGTVVSSADVDEGDETVFGYGSVLKLIGENGENPGVQHLKEVCLEHCPPRHKAELETVLSGKTKRPAGMYLHGRMVNLPLEIVEVLHQQLVLDMDWAVENAVGGEEGRKALDFGAFVLLAPCFAGDKTPDGKMPSSVIYKNFDDEVFASRAEFVFTFEAPRRLADEDRQFVNVVVLAKTGHREAMKDLANLVRGG